MSYIVKFDQPSTYGLESSPVADTLAGLRANEARYLKNKYGHELEVTQATEAKDTLIWVNTIFKNEKDIAILSRPLQASSFDIESIHFAYVFYENGLAANVMYSADDKGKRAVGLKLSEGMETPPELAAKFKFARQRSRLAGTIRGSYFIIKGEYPWR
jgi:hypothetical protein